MVLLDFQSHRRDLAYTHYKEEGLPTVIVRLFNTVGPRQTGAYGMVIPTFADQALAGQPLTVHGDGSQAGASVTWPTWSRDS